MGNTTKRAAAGSSAKKGTSAKSGSTYFDIVRSLSTDPELFKAVDAAEERDRAKKG